MNGRLLRRVPPSEIRARRGSAVDPRAVEAVRPIIEHVRREGHHAVARYAAEFGEGAPGEPLVIGIERMHAALDTIGPELRSLLERTAERIRAFASAQREAVASVDRPIPGGRAGHAVLPVESAGCYAPGGRYPLPSSVLMTAVTARAAGCRRVVVASPNASPVMLAAAAAAGADQFLAAGGAHAVAAIAFGIEGLEPCDVIAGPGNRYVTAAKHIVSDTIGIDMLAGPSELLIIADASADPDTIAADLLAQAEHDPDAVPMLVAIGPGILDAAEACVASRLRELPTRVTAAESIRNGFACEVGTLDQACAIADRVGPEHLELLVEHADRATTMIINAGALFLGNASAEVLGDYGAGPNHTLPTGGTSRFSAGLSVMHFLRLRTWLRIDDTREAEGLIADARALARTEGLFAHEASAALRLR